jgi:endoglucanase
MMLAFHPAPTVTPGLGDGYWHTAGSQILDTANRPVRIAGVNWYGFETTQGIPGGLDVQDYKSIVETIRHNGFNTIRLPLSNQMVESPTVPTALHFSNPSGPINTDLKGLNSLQILDRIITYAGSRGLKVILDNHRSEAGDGAEMSGLWFTQAYPESSWIADWKSLANRYSNNPAVIGFDLRNEPHNASAGGSCWSCGGEMDWHLAAQRAGDATLKINPNLLIFVEGVDTFENDSYWWGGNLMGVRTAPVKLAVPHQLVYSPHDYGPVESPQPWLTPTMTPASLAEVWSKHWAYISQEGIAPVWLGEFGIENPNLDNPSPVQSMEAAWFQGMIQFLTQNPRISWAYWTLNGNDHNGLLNASYDATPRSPANMEALSAIQFPLSIGTAPSGKRSAHSFMPSSDVPAREVRTADATVVTVVPPADATPTQCHVAYTNKNDWQKGFTAAISIQNRGSAPLNGWKLTWTFPGDQKVTQLWSGNYAQDGRSVTITNLDFNATIPPNGEQTGIGFNADYSGRNQVPAKFFLNGTLCN